jgi:hypothetical protein
MRFLELNEGFKIVDILAKPWILGKPIGQGGFGLIYIGIKSFFD